MSIDLIIAGASARAAAFSASRAGLRPACIDLFADADLRALGPVTRLPGEAYPDGIAVACAQSPPAPWMYTGALENRPDVIATISKERSLWGCSAQAVARVRSPRLLSEALAKAGLPGPSVLVAGEAVPTNGSWLLKPLASAAGFGIRVAAGVVPDGCFGQEFIEGPSCSGLFIGHKLGAVFLGATAQLIGTEWLHAAPFHYAGSVGPLELSPSTSEHFAKLGNVLAGQMGLRGIFGVDCILSEGLPRVVEVNPRYTASVEVWEYAREQSALLMHRQVFEQPEQDVASMLGSNGAIAQVVGKGIYFAKEALTIPVERPWHDPTPGGPLGFDMPLFADLPGAGDRIEKGHPVLTMLVRGDSVDTCLAELECRARALDRWFHQD